MMPGEGAEWSRVTSTAGFFNDKLGGEALWMLEMGNDTTVKTENVFFVCDGSGRPVATATAKFIAEDQLANLPAVDDGLGYLHYVAALPECRGKGAGSAVTAAVLNRFSELGYGSCVLTTDDPRLAAIKSYLRLGWLPVLNTPDMRCRWEKVLAGLGIADEVMAIDGEGKNAAPIVAVQQ
jgi:mycothiol synthase